MNPDQNARKYQIAFVHGTDGPWLSSVFAALFMFKITVGLALLAYGAIFSINCLDKCSGALVFHKCFNWIDMSIYQNEGYRSAILFPNQHEYFYLETTNVRITHSQSPIYVKIWAFSHCFQPPVKRAVYSNTFKLIESLCVHKSYLLYIYLQCRGWPNHSTRFGNY